MREVPAAIEHEDVFDLGQRLAVEAPSRNADGPALLVERLGVREIDETVLCELRMERDVHVAVHGSWQSRLASPVRRRRAATG